MNFKIALACAFFAAPVITHAAELGPNDYPFAKGEVLTYDSNRNSIRRGTLNDGRIDYTIHKNGLIEVSTGWRSICATDKITDERHCAVTNDKANFSILLDEKGDVQTACLTNHNYPGKVGAVRVDTNAPHVTDAKGCVDASVVEEIIQGKKFTTRQTKFPNEIPSDREGKSDGLEAAIAITKHVNTYRKQIGIY